MSCSNIASITKSGGHPWRVHKDLSDWIIYTLICWLVVDCCSCHTNKCKPIECVSLWRCWRLAHSAARSKRSLSRSGRGSGLPVLSAKGQGIRRGKGSEKSVLAQRVKTKCRGTDDFSFWSNIYLPVCSGVVDTFNFFPDLNLRTKKLDAQVVELQKPNFMR